MTAILRFIALLMVLAMVAGCSRYAEFNKPRARRDVNPPPDHDYCWKQAELRAADQYDREGARTDQGRYSAYGRSSLSGDLRRMDAQRLREELYENCLRLRAQQRDADKAAADQAAADAAGAQGEAVSTQATADDYAADEAEDLLTPPPMQ